MFRQLYVAVLCAASLLLSGCGGSQHTPTEKYYLVAANVKLPYWQQVAAGFTQAAGQLGVKAEVVGPETYDVQAQRAEFAKVLTQQPAGILVAATDPSLKEDIDAAVDKGIPVITVDSDAPDSSRFTFIGTDNYKAGLLGGNLVAKQLHSRGRVVVYTLPNQQNLKARLRGYTDAFAGHPLIKIDEVVDAHGDPKVVAGHVTSLLDKGAPVDAFVCLVSFAGPEVANVLTAKNVKGKIVVAMDTDDRTLAAIQNGTILATLGQRPFTMAFVGLKMLDDLHHYPPASLKARSADDAFSVAPSFVDTGINVVDERNVDHVIKDRSAIVKKK
jgi:ribose transport system substrate-binding protein